MKSDLNQEVRVVLDVSITLARHYDADEVKEIVERGVRRIFPNNFRHFHEARFAEEAQIYSTKSGQIEWTWMIHPKNPERREGVNTHE